MLRTRLISFLRKRRLYPRDCRKLISSWQRLLKKMSVKQMRRKRKARLNGMVQDGRKSCGGIGVCLWVLYGGPSGFVCC